MKRRYERIFPRDSMSKRERVEATLHHEPVDRVALHEQLSFNPGVIALYTGRAIEGFNYGFDDICEVIRKTLDMCFPPTCPRGTARVRAPDGFVVQHDNWTTWTVSRPFHDVEGATGWLLGKIEHLRASTFDAAREREEYRRNALEIQARIGETVLCQVAVDAGLCNIYTDHGMGLELFSYLDAERPGLVDEYLLLYQERCLRRIHAVADASLSPVILIAEDFGTKQGPIFNPEFLKRRLYPAVRAYADAWHEHGIHVLYHSDGNYRKAIPDLMACGVDGFYCLEPNCGMDIVELKNTWPQMVWAGGVDGVDLLERGTPEQVRAEVRRHILGTDALQTGGMFVASSSEINPPIRPENFRAMIEVVDELRSAGPLTRKGCVREGPP